jgi:hypothetical protein
MRVKIMGVNERLKFIFKLVVYWSIGIVAFLGGTFYGRWLERNCWETVLEEVQREYQTLEILEKIIKAESGGRHNSFGVDGEKGVAQFKESTFYWMAEKAGLGNPNWNDQVQQIVLLNWAIRNGYAARHW